MGDPQDVICIVASTSPLDLNSVTTSWTGPNGFITNNHRITINATVKNNFYTTILHFDYLFESDEGIYTCDVTTNNHTVSLSTSIAKLTST